jgi:hypothetical protein
VPPRRRGPGAGERDRDGSRRRPIGRSLIERAGRDATRRGGVHAVELATGDTNDPGSGERGGGGAREPRDANATESLASQYDGVGHGTSEAVKQGRARDFCHVS